MTRMKGLEPRFEGRPVTVLVYEYVTGGGLIGQDLPESWAAEGSAMRRAIARDFAAVLGVRVVMMLDERLPMESHPGVESRVVRKGGTAFNDLLCQTKLDYTLAIAPETGGVLRELTFVIERWGGCSLGSGHRSIGLTADKARLADHFVASGIPTPETCRMKNLAGDLPTDWTGPIVVKPRLGAGSVDTFIIRDCRNPNWQTRHRDAVAQRYFQGEPMSASFLVDVAGRSTFLGIGHQRIEIDHEGKISYRGGTILSEMDECPGVVKEAIDSVSDLHRDEGLRGFVGVDYLDDPEAGITVLEINPRPTTSYVGLATMFGPGMISGAWLDAMQEPLDQTDWPDRLHSLRQGSDVSFDADGTIVSED
jgi:tyramine---L-glutamate ligase